VSILTKAYYLSFLSPSFPKIIIQEFLFCSFAGTCDASLLFPSSLETIIHEFFFSSFASTIKPLGIFVSICVEACGASFLSPSFLEIIIQELFYL